MASKQEKRRLREVWKQRLHEWKASGKSLSSWCSQKGIPYHRGLYWKSRLLPEESTLPNNKSQKRFVEICEKDSSESGISIDAGGVRIVLSKSFDAETLHRCLNALKG